MDARPKRHILKKSMSGSNAVRRKNEIEDRLIAAIDAKYSKREIDDPGADLTPSAGYFEEI